MHDDARAPHGLVIEYRPLTGFGALPPDALAAFTFGRPIPGDDPRWVRVGLASLDAEPVVEVWRVRAAAGAHDAPAPAPALATPWRESVAIAGRGEPCIVRGASLGAFHVGCLELDEAAYGGIEGASAAAYAAFARLAGTPRAPHVLRMWNYLDAINVGDGDDERYRRFCTGRAESLAGYRGPQLPAATAIGRHDGERVLQVYWLACDAPGVAVENPRQVSAWRYPRQYGPSPPRFSRAMRAADTVFVSGTASVVGHETRHAECFDSQVGETVENLATVLAAAGVPGARARALLLKCYVRDPAEGPRAREQLARLLPRATALTLAADVCRSDLLFEIDCVARLD